MLQRRKSRPGAILRGCCAPGGWSIPRILLVLVLLLLLLLPQFARKVKASSAFTFGTSLANQNQHRGRKTKIKTNIQRIRPCITHHHFLYNHPPTRKRSNPGSDRTTTTTTTTRSINRRLWIQAQVALTAGLLSLATTASLAKNALATDSLSLTNWTTVRAELGLVTNTLQTLLTNWERAVIDCTYADVPRELLEQKNKALLLEKASTFALFDKSVSVTSCKTVNNRVRDYLGRTGIGPVAGLEALLQKTVALALLTENLPTMMLSTNTKLQSNNLEDDPMDAIVQTVEEIQRQLTRADSLSYSARRDFTSMNNFNPDEMERVLDDPNSNLALCKAAIQMAVDQLNLLLTLLPLE